MNFLEIKNLKTFFHTRSGTVRAVDDISLTIRKGEIVGIVGESGSVSPLLVILLLDFFLSLQPGSKEEVYIFMEMTL